MAKSQGGIITKPSDIKQEIVVSFKNLNAKERIFRPSCSVINFRRLSLSSSSLLEIPVSMEEFKTAMWECDGNKAPGPDDINSFFIEKAWDFVGLDILNMVEDFFFLGYLPKGICSSFITRIPKLAGATCLKDLRPTSLIGCLYKIIAKVLAKRLKGVMPEIIGGNQNSFIKGSQVLDSVFIANKVISYLKKNKLQGYLFSYALYGLRKQTEGLDQAVHLHSQSIGAFLMEKGLRQGDPSSPFLLNIAEEGLGKMIEEGCDLGSVEGISGV